MSLGQQATASFPRVGGPFPDYFGLFRVHLFTAERPPDLACPHDQGWQGSRASRRRGAWLSELGATTPCTQRYYSPSPLPVPKRRGWPLGPSSAHVESARPRYISCASTARMLPAQPTHHPPNPLFSHLPCWMLSQEMKSPVPTEPFWFLKPPSSYLASGGKARTPSFQRVSPNSVHILSSTSEKKSAPQITRNGS